MPGPAGVPAAVLGAGERSDDGWAGEELTERELARLAARDRASVLAGELAEDEQWLPDPWDDFQEAASPEALPGLSRRHRGTGGGFGAGGVADSVPPGPVLAGLAAGKQDAGMAGVSDDELAGLMIAWRRIASWAAAGELAAIAELDRRRTIQAAAAADPRLAEHVADEVAMVLTLTSRAASKLTDFALGLVRLPRTRAALHAGDIDVPKALVVIDELTGLDAPHAARVEDAVIGRAPGQTTGELRRSARLAVLTADPEAARKRKEKAAKDARVECWQEQAGTSALAGRDLPPADALAADHRISAYARWLKNAGADGTLDGLRARVYLALLNGQPVEALLPMTEEGAEAGEARRRDTGPGGMTLTPGDIPPEPGGMALTPGGVPPGGMTLTPGVIPLATPGAPQVMPAVRGSVNLTVPLATWLGWSQVPGEVAGFGPLDAADSRALTRALARDPATRWCVTVVGADGRAVAHGCAKAGPGQTSGGPPGPPRPPPVNGPGPSRPPPVNGPGPSRPPPVNPPGPPRRRPVSPSASPVSPPGPPAPPAGVGTWLAGIGLAWLDTGTCSHRWESVGYRPSPSLAHLVQIRQQRCTAPGCRRPARLCDFEHTIAWHQGGRTCLCNGGPCCRRHHRCKQAPGWQLAQPRPGEFIWTTPHGRRYRTEPEPYPG